MRSHPLPSYPSNSDGFLRRCRNRIFKWPQMGQKIRDNSQSNHFTMLILDIFWYMLRLYRYHCHKFPTNRWTLLGLWSEFTIVHCCIVVATDSAVMDSKLEISGAGVDGGQHIHGNRIGHYVLLSHNGFARSFGTADDSTAGHDAGLLLHYYICNGGDWRCDAVGELNEDTSTLCRYLRCFE